MACDPVELYATLVELPDTVSGGLLIGTYRIASSMKLFHKNNDFRED